MPIQNNKSVQKGVRIPNTEAEPHYAHLVKKAKSNPENQHNQVATEINILIKSDFEKSQKKSRK